MPDLPEYPGIADSRTSHHDAIYSVSVPILQRLLRAVDISIAKNGDLYMRVVLHFSDKGPICLSLVQLIPGPAMNGQGGNTHILQPHGHLLDVPGTFIPPKAGLYRDGQTCRLYTGSRQPHHSFNVF